jgi:hypothetical protein
MIKNLRKLFITKENRTRSGFTLIELSIYMGITMVIILILAELLSAIFSTQLTSQATSYTVQDGRYVYTRLIYDINRAQSVSVPANLGDSTNSLTLNIGGSEYSYSLSGGNLVITDTQGVHLLNSTDTTISNLTFMRIGNTDGKHTFKINYTVTSKIVDKGPAETKVFQTTAGLR